jgi:hypothetical protein
MADEHNRLYVDRLNAMMRDILGDIVGEGPSGSYGPTGSFIAHPEGRRVYHYYQLGDVMFAYTSYPDREGKYFAWTYKPKGPGSRTGKAKRWIAKEVASFRHKSAAKRRAYDRYETARQKSSEQSLEPPTDL